MKVFVQNVTLHGLTHSFLKLISRPVSFEGQSPKSLCFYPHAPAVCPLQTQQATFRPKRSILVSSGHRTFYNPPLAKPDGQGNFRLAWTFDGLSRGTFQALQNCNHWKYSVLLIVTLISVVPALYRSLTSPPPPM